MARRKLEVVSNSVSQAAVPLVVTRDSPPASRAEYVYQALRLEIVDGVLPPGSSILQDQVAERLGVSITPVREALRKLESDGLVSYQTNFGATVVKLSKQALLELYQLRASLEGLTARLAAAVITSEQLGAIRSINDAMRNALRTGDLDVLTSGSREFHSAIAIIGGPAFLGEHLNWVRQKFPNPSAESLWRDPMKATELIEIHTSIYEALAAGDGNRAERLMAEHIHGVGIGRAALDRS